MTKLLTTLSILFIATAVSAESWSVSYPDIDINKGETYTVERGIDCDTLKLTSGEEVRLIGVKCLEDEKMGQEATEFVKRLIKKGQKVRLEFDVQEKDKYERTLAYIYSLVCEGDCAIEAVQGYNYKKLNDGWYVFINATIIKAGYARHMPIPPNVKYAQLFEALYKEAREQRRGLWKGINICNENKDCEEFCLKFVCYGTKAPRCDSEGKCLCRCLTEYWG